MEGNLNLYTSELALSYLISNNLNESAFYWDIIATDGVFEQSSSNGPFLWYGYIGEDPLDNEETFIDLLLAIGTLDIGVAQPIMPHLSYITQKMSRLTYLITF